MLTGAGALQNLKSQIPVTVSTAEMLNTVSKVMSKIEDIVEKANKFMSRYPSER